MKSLDAKRLGSPRENTKPTVSISSWSLHGVDWSFTRPWSLQDTMMWSVFLLLLGVQKLMMYSFVLFFLFFLCHMVMLIGSWFAFAGQYYFWPEMSHVQPRRRIKGVCNSRPMYVCIFFLQLSFNIIWKTYILKDRFACLLKLLLRCITFAQRNIFRREKKNKLLVSQYSVTEQYVLIFRMHAWEKPEYPAECIWDQQEHYAPLCLDRIDSCSLTETHKASPNLSSSTHSSTSSLVFVLFVVSDM